jgi:hypothetical protein
VELGRQLLLLERPFPFENAKKVTRDSRAPSWLSRPRTDVPAEPPSHRPCGAITQTTHNGGGYISSRSYKIQPFRAAGAGAPAPHNISKANDSCHNWKGLAHKYPTDLNDDNFAAEMQHLPLVYIKQILEYKN